MSPRTTGDASGDDAIGAQATALSGRGFATPQSGATVRLAKVCPACFERYPGDFRVCPRDATELTDVSADEEVDTLLGATVGDTFCIVRAIGEGGMARVYEGRHVRLPNRRFAIKVLHHMYAQQPTIVARFQREAEAASGIAHPNVVDVFDVGTTPDGRPYLVSEFLEGKDFATLLDERGHIEAAAAVHVVRQVCRALTAAHARGVVHRDVKPENVFLVGDMDAPIVKVLDFGISKFDVAGGATLTQTGMIMGTPGYMPPEQARGGKTDQRADVYGVGAMLYRALTGQLPYDSDDASETLGMVLGDEPPPRPRSIQPSIPEALEMVIELSMSKNPDDRYQSMAELDERLAPFEPESSSKVSLLPPPPGSLRHRGGVKATLATPTARSPSVGDVERDTREARLARPTLVMLSFVAYAWLVGSSVDGGTSALVHFRGAAEATPMTRLVVTIVVVALSLAPVVFWLRHLADVWKSSVRAVEHARALRRVVLAATVPYAFLSLGLRVLTPPADPRLPTLLAGVSLATAFVAYVVGRMGGRRRRG